MRNADDVPSFEWPLVFDEQERPPSNGPIPSEGLIDSEDPAYSGWRSNDDDPFSFLSSLEPDGPEQYTPSAPSASSRDQMPFVDMEADISNSRDIADSSLKTIKNALKW